ncbi:hypothetical protein [Microbacterium terregens]|uniref:Uncharacterized protein n=1 Tax=Microbacterium terregens TaxID=69363 RepID=A0ABV5T3E6_9MICO
MTSRGTPADRLAAWAQRAREVGSKEHEQASSLFAYSAMLIVVACVVGMMIAAAYQ